MTIKIYDYEYSRVNDVLVVKEIPHGALEKFWKAIVVFGFRVINYRHCYLKDDRGKLYVNKIIEIRGWNRCLYDDNWGQRIVGEFI